MNDKVEEIDPLRNAALAGSEAYRCKSNQNASYGVAAKVKKVVDTMPILTRPVADKLAEKITDKAHQSVASSVWGKIKTKDNMGIDDMIKFCKEQKYDKLFDGLVLIISYG